MHDLDDSRPASALRRNASALLVIDMITEFDFEDGDELYETALAAARSLAELKSAALGAKVPVIYVNDNHGKWQEDMKSMMRSIDSAGGKGKNVLDLIRPGTEDYHVLKPQRSGFYGTPLSVLLFSLDVSNLIITGITTDICVLFTAHDAYMRGFAVQVPPDCTAAVKESHHSDAIRFIKRVAKADVRHSSEIEFNVPVGEHA